MPETIQQICVPDYVNPVMAKYAFMYIDGGHTDDPAPTEVDALTEFVCVLNQGISAALLQIPNEPIVFKKEGKNRSEDGM